MARVKKVTPAVDKALRDKNGVPLRSAVESEQDIIVIPGFEADTISFAPALPAIQFCDCAGRQVIVRLTKNGLFQWKWQTRNG